MTSFDSDSGSANTYETPSQFIQFTSQRKTYLIYDALYANEWRQWWSIKNWPIANPKHDYIWDGDDRRSPAWDNYDSIVYKLDGRPFLRCKRCEEILEHPSIKHTGTSMLKRHITTKACIQKTKAKGKEPIREFLEAQGQTERGLKTLYSSSFHKASVPEFHAQTIRVLAALKLSFNALGNIELQKWIEMAHQFPADRGLLVLTPYQIKDRLEQEALDVRRRILTLRPSNSKLAIATDCWTSPNHKSFMAITGYFIDTKWRYQEVLLGFEHINGSHTGQRLAEVMQKTFEECNILPEDISTITTDNASNNATMLKKLNTASDIVNKEFQLRQISRIPCLAHVIQLACSQVLSGVKILPEYDQIQESGLDEYWLSKVSLNEGPPSTLTKLRRFVITINSSTQKRDQFLSFQTIKRPLNLIQDVRTRWNSTLRMIMRAYKLRDAISNYIDANPKEGYKFFTKLEWRHMEYLIEVLTPFMKFTNLIGMIRNGPTMQLVLQVYEKLFDHLDRNINRLHKKRSAWKMQIKLGLEAGRQKLNEYYQVLLTTEGQLYGVAALLDPTLKGSLQQSPEYEEYLDALEKLYKSYRNQSASQSSQSQTQSQELVQPSQLEPIIFPIRKRKDRNDDLSDLYALKAKKRVRSTTEIEWYLDDQYCFGLHIERPQASTILEYWRRAENRLPVLSQIARDLLATPAAGVGVERLFNEARDICDYRRHHLQPRTIKYLMLLAHGERLIVRDHTTPLVDFDRDTEELDQSEWVNDWDEDDAPNAIGYISDESENGLVMDI